MADPTLDNGSNPSNLRRPEADPPPPGHNEATGTQLSPAKPHSRGENILALAVGAAILTAIGVLLSTFQGLSWAIGSITLCALGLLLAGVAAFLGFSGGRKNIATASAGLATAALLFLIFVIMRQSGDGEGEEGAELADGIPTAAEVDAP